MDDLIGYKIDNNFCNTTLKILIIFMKKKYYPIICYFGVISDLNSINKLFYTRCQTSCTFVKGHKAGTMSNKPEKVCGK